MVLLMVLSFYTVISSAVGEKKEYETCLAEARRLAELEVLEDALTYYQQALEIRDTVEVTIEIGEMYTKNGWISDAVSWGEYVVEHFPEEPKAYDYLLKQYIEAGFYDDCFELREEAIGRNTKSAEFDEIMKEIEYVYEFANKRYEDVSIYSSGYTPYMDDEGLWGYADACGKNVIKAQFKWAGAFSSDGIAPVQSTDGEFYYISASGNKKVAVQNLTKCMDLGMSIDKVLPAGDNGVYSYYNQDFEKVIEGEYQMALPMNGGVAAVLKDGKWSLINEKGKALSKDTYDAVIYDEKGIVYRNERIFVKSGTKVLMIDEKGNQIGKTTYEDAKPFFSADGLAAVKVNGLWGFVDKDGNMVIEPKYNNARSSSNGFAAVQVGSRWGFVDIVGNVVIEPLFEDAKDFTEKETVFVKDSSFWTVLKLIRSNY